MTGSIVEIGQSSSIVIFVDQLIIDLKVLLLKWSEGIDIRGLGIGSSDLHLFGVFETSGDQTWGQTMATDGSVDTDNEEMEKGIGVQTIEQIDMVVHMIEQLKNEL